MYFLGIFCTQTIYFRILNLFSTLFFPALTITKSTAFILNAFSCRVTCNFGRILEFPEFFYPSKNWCGHLRCSHGWNCRDWRIKYTRNGSIRL